ncbi:MAG: hypothetical protein Tsb0013_14360 [Phycisphaerales bacterium]
MDDIRSGNEIRDTEGQVKWFDPKKGFGFIVGPDGQDIFTHYTRIEGEGFRVLEDGAKVRYSAELTEKGWHATSVERLEDDDARPQRRYARTIRR